MKDNTNKNQNEDYKIKKKSIFDKKNWFGEDDDDDDFFRNGTDDEEESQSEASGEKTMRIDLDGEGENENDGGKALNKDKKTTIKSLPKTKEAIEREKEREKEEKEDRKREKERQKERPIKEKKKRAPIKESVAAPLLVAILFILLLLSRMLDIESLAGEGNVFLVIIVIELMIFILPGIFFVKTKDGSYITKMNIRFFSLGSIPIIIFAFIVMVTGTVLIQLGLFRAGIINPSDGAYEAYAYVSTYSDFSEVGKVLYAAAVFAVIPAICEEFIFRSVVMTEYEVLGGVASCMTTSLLFAMSHFDIKQFIIYFFAGLILSLVAFVTRSVFSTMVLHAAFNIFSLFAQSFLWSLISQSVTTIFFVFIIAAAFLVFLMLCFGEAERLTRSNAKEGLHTEGEKSSRRTQKPLVEALLSPTFLVCCGLFAFAVIIK